ncbi:MAG TPA: MFS transporter [Chlamydiales bacterium]|nr:MFS transporter [Chlamydiales bacterium]
MKQLFRKAFGIYSGEGTQAFRFARLAILWAFGSSCFDTLSDGLFLEKIGAEFLPRVYLSIALGMIGVSTLVLYSLRLTSPYRILMTAMALGAMSCVAASFVVGTGPPIWFWYLLKIVSRMFFAVMIACSWTFTDQYHDLQDAKRVYSIYSAAYFFGTILSGTAINLFLDFIGFSGLLIASAISILFGMVEARGIALKTRAVHDDTMEGVFSGSRDSFASVVQLIVRSRFAIVLLCLSLFVQLLLTVTEFNYMNSFGHFFSAQQIAGEGQIAEFLGKCRAMISLCNIVFGVFFYGRFIRRMGLNNALLITPLFFVAVYSGWVFQDAMLFAVLGLVAVDGILFTVEDNCFNLLSNAVPAKLKSKVRIINDSFFEPIGMLLSALLLFGLQSGSRWLGFTLTLIVLVLALIIRATYSKAIFINLKDNALHFEKKLKGWLATFTRREQKEAKKDIFEALNSPSEEAQLLAIESLLQMGDPNAIPRILQTTSHLGTLSKIQFLRLLDNSAFENDARAIELIDLWSYENGSSELSKWANFYLAKRGLHHPEKAEEDLDHDDLLLRGAAILTLKKSLANQSLDYAALNRTIAAKKLDLMLKSSHIDEISLGLDILAEDNTLEAAEKALPFLSHESVLVKRSAARCTAKLADKRLSRHAPRLIEELSAARDNAFRLHLLDALGKIADSTTIKEILLASVHFRPNERRRAEENIIQMGLKIVPLLLTLTKDISLPERARILASKILGRLALPQLQANLFDILDIEIERAYFYFYFGHTIQNQHPLYDLEMLQSALLTGYQSVIDFIIHLLGAAGSLEDPELLVRALHSRNAKVHSHAVESLEKTCDLRIFRLIAPLVDDLPLEEKMAACLRWHGDYPQLTLSELLGKLDQSPSLFDKIVAVRLKAKLQMPNWRQQLREQMKHSDETFHQFAYELLET